MCEYVRANEKINNFKTKSLIILISHLHFIEILRHFFLYLILQNFLIYILAFLEVVAIHWIYGLKNFIYDIEFMLGRKTGIYWRVCWSIVIPLLLLYIFINILISQKSITSGGYTFGGGALGKYCMNAVYCIRNVERS